ncbi:hypothetical protein A3Q56_08623, partial [Intoshia linei]
MNSIVGHNNNEENKPEILQSQYDKYEIIMGNYDKIMENQIENMKKLFKTDLEKLEDEIEKFSYTVKKNYPKIEDLDNNIDIMEKLNNCKENEKNYFEIEKKCNDL